MINELRIDGRMGRDPEIKQTIKGDVVKFSLAVTDRKKVNDEWVDGETSWYGVEYWLHDSDDRSKFKTGAYICLRGRLKTDTWERDGQKQTRVKIAMTSVESWEFIKGGKVSGEAPRQSASQSEPVKPSGEPGPQAPYENDIAFAPHDM